MEKDIDRNEGITIRRHLLGGVVIALTLTVGVGGIYLVDWRDATSYYPQQQTAVMGAFSERRGTLLWSTPIG